MIGPGGDRGRDAGFPAPPHRSECAGLAHSAPALGAEAESHIGVGVRSSTSCDA